jgi:serine/threonine protein kinase
MVFTVPLAQAQKDFPQYAFVEVLTPSEQKAAFHVRDTRGNDLCLKIISPSYQIDRLAREIKALQTIKHPNVVSLLEYTFTSKAGEQRHYMIEEFIPGTDLSIQLLPNNLWTSIRAASFFSSLCDGLACLNKDNIITRDKHQAGSEEDKYQSHRETVKH